MKWIAIFLSLFVSTAIAGESVCKPTPVGKTEPEELIIHEDDFSHEKALYALSVLSHITEKPPSEFKGSESYIETGNAEIELKGYILKSQCLLSKDIESCLEFCNYIFKRRYWFD